MSRSVRGFCLGLACVFAIACGGSREPTTYVEKTFLVVVNYDIFHDLEPSLNHYAAALGRRGVEVHIEPWAPGTFDELRALVFRYVDEEQIEGALLVGSLPAAWYEQEVFEKLEAFPTDIVLQDRDAIWTDADDDGVFDAHTPLKLDLYTSRIDGTVEELKEYFDRVDYYRHIGPLVNVRAFVFMDDPWSSRYETQAMYLDRIYEQVLIMHEPSDTTLDNYIGVLTGAGAEFVYQGSHSGSTYLSIKEESSWEGCTCDELSQLDIRASFFNLFNCLAARFTEENLAHAYVMRTGHGLALVGSTKLGAIRDARLFHLRLAEGRTWGEAYLDWYNEVGVASDEWHLGIVLMGDPLLHLHGDTLPRAFALSATWESPPEDSELMIEIARTAELGTFEEYRAAHPEFFED